MFEDWARQLADIEIASLDDRAARRLLAASARHRAAHEAFEARLAVLLGESAAVRGATRCTQREADQAVARGELIAAAPQVGEALAAGEISGAHVDTLARAASRTSVEDVAESRLLELARAKPADAMQKHVSDFVRRNGSDDDLEARRRRQLRRRRAFFAHDDMGVLHAEFDDTTFGQVRAVVEAEMDRLYRAQGGRDGASELATTEQRRADAIARLLLGARRGEDGGSVASGPPSARHQMMIVVYADGSGEIPGVGPLPKSEIARLAATADLFGVVFSTDGVPLWHGRRVRLADDNQVRALVARDGGCVGCGADPNRCEAHHLVWWEHGGRTDITNLVLVCSHCHHLIHDNGWQLTRAPDGSWTLAPP